MENFPPPVVGARVPTGHQPNMLATRAPFRLVSRWAPDRVWMGRQSVCVREREREREEGERKPLTASFKRCQKPEYFPHKNCYVPLLEKNLINFTNNEGKNLNFSYHKLTNFYPFKWRKIPKFSREKSWNFSPSKNGKWPSCQIRHNPNLSRVNPEISIFFSSHPIYFWQPMNNEPQEVSVFRQSLKSPTFYHSVATNYFYKINLCAQFS